MMVVYLINRRKSKSLTAQIRDAERQVLNRQREVDVRASKLVSKIHQQMAAPANLLLAGGIGFIIGELTKRQAPDRRGTADEPGAARGTPLRTALNLMTSVQTIYAALPIAWMIKYVNQQGASGRQAPKRQSQPIPAASGAAAGNLRRSMR